MMHIKKVIDFLHSKTKKEFDIYERSPEKYQLILPILHEDGDMVDVYLQDSPNGQEYIRICDFGMAIMRLSCTYEINSDARQRIFNNILINSGVQNNQGNLYLDSTLETLYENILQFTGCVQKVCNMRHWGTETTKNVFYDDLKNYITIELGQFNPAPNKSPLLDYPIVSVDWSLTHNDRNLYLFGILGNNKAKVAAIALLEFQKAHIPFIGIVVHEDMDILGKKERLYLTKNADKQYPVLDDFKEKAVADITRLAA